ncbi:uncharacterized protein LOC123685415 [Harmonia axyridis]|uniref:uncharacterized protein LOC123685415 n=1 Tax=Harmonia axyridis TaxID=115357 RepID=UPI001E27800E|nr:uncharacterized protein LOC123685415 [Harmonia axyridis]
MEVIKCGLCKEEIEYAQRCRVYITTNEPRPYQRTSKRPHIGRYKLLSTANSTEHISFARRLKRLRQIKKQKSSVSSSENSSISKADPKKQPSIKKEENSKKVKAIEKIQPEGKPIESREKEFLESTEKASKTIEKVSLKSTKKASFGSRKKPSSKTTEKKKASPKSTGNAPLPFVKKSSEISTKGNNKHKIIIQNCEILKKAHSVETTNLEDLKINNYNRCTIRKSTSAVQKSKKIHLFEQNMNHPQFQNSFEEYIKPSLPKSNSTLSVERTQITADKKMSTDMSSESEQLKLVRTTTTPKPVKNGSAINSKNSDCETYYWLEMPKPKQPEPRKLGYQFDNLVAEVKHMKLPNPNWKIKIMVHKQEMVSVSFTKKLVPEKVVTVNAKSLVCDITIDAKKIVLLGSPIFIHSIKDLEIMLDIVDDIEPNSPMINYIKT